MEYVNEAAKVQCPFCDCVNDIEVELAELGEVDFFDETCGQCNRAFEVHIDFNPVFSTKPFVYKQCGICQESTRDFFEKETYSVFPRYTTASVLCIPCWIKHLEFERIQERKNNGDEV